MRATALALLLACAPRGRGAPCDSGAPVSWEGFGQGFFTTYCRSCHSSGLSERYGAPEGVNLDTEAEVLAQEARIRARVLTDGDMPPGGGVLPGDLDLLERYLDCATADQGG